MSFNFIDKTFTIGGEGTPMLQFYNRGFVLGSGKSEPTWKDIIISGNTALTLVNAKADGLNYVTVFGATEQSNLPNGYTQLQYVQNAATTTKINTGVMPEVGDELEIRFITPYTASTSNYLLQSRESNNAGIYGISGSLSGKTILLSWGPGNSVTSAITREYNHEYIVKASVIGTTLTLYVKDITAGTEDTVTGTITTPSDATTPYFIWGNTSQWLQQVTPVYYVKITNNGTTKLNYVASKDSNDSASFYDLVNDTFITTFDGTITGSADVATPTPVTPISILTNNGTIKVSRNLFDINKAVLGDIASTTGDISTGILYRIVSDFIPVSIGQSYVASGKICFEGNANEYDSKLITAFYDSNKVFIADSRIVRQNIFTFEIPDGASFVRVEYWGDPASGNTVDLVNSKLQFELGTTATPYMPYGEIYTDGTVETVEVYGNNLIDLSAITNGYYYNPNGVYTSLSNSRLTDYIPIEAGKNVKVYFKSLSSASTLNVRINLFDSNKVWQNQEVLQLKPLAEGTMIVTATYNGYIRVSGNYSGFAIVDWNTASITEPLGSATAEMLLKVGNYQDVQSVLDGAVTRNVGIKVLDGTENLFLQSTGFVYIPVGVLSNMATVNAFNGYCTHAPMSGNINVYGIRLGNNNTAAYWYRFADETGCTTTAEAKQWLATQYANGTPVIIVYPLETSTTETVTGQTLTTKAGTNTITATGAIDDLELEVSYKAGVSVTITQIQNANLDNSVVITIGE